MPGFARLTGNVRLVPYSRWRQLLAALAVALVVLVAAVLGYWLGGAKVTVDTIRLASLEIHNRANAAEIDQLRHALVDARLAQTIDAEAAQSLRQTLSGLRDELAGLREEVTFYKSLMAPSDEDVGLQIAGFEVTPGRRKRQFTYRLLLTQVETRRDWIQGTVSLEVRGRRDSPDGPAEEVLALTDLTKQEPYPVPYRFRYFQDIAGTLTLPDGFEPVAVQVSVNPGGGGAPVRQRRFDWVVAAG